ncbi:MAG: GFA family protein [Novosphingobium sp.]|nr:GFA family protein [Novosphingobium sp.]
MAEPRCGGCRCGAIRYEISGKPIAGVACHCRDCQFVAGGSPNLTWLFAHSGFELLRGNPTVYRATATSGGSNFCSICGVQVYSRPDKNDHLIAIKVGTLDDPSEFQVDADIWMKSAQPWHRKHNGAQQFEGNP